MCRDDDQTEIPTAQSVGFRQSRFGQDDQKADHHRQEERVQDLRPHRQPDQVWYRPNKCCASDHAHGVDAIEEWAAERLNFRRSTVAGSLAEGPSESQRAHDRRDDGRPEHAETEDQPSRSDAEMRNQRLADLSHTAQRGACITSPEGGSRDEQNRSAHQLGKHRAQCRIPSRRSVVPVVQPLFDDGGLLIENHQGLKTAPIKAAARSQKPSFPRGMSKTSRATVPIFGRVVAATMRKASSNEPIKIATLSTRR